jgi:hypothetical protein
LTRTPPSLLNPRPAEEEGCCTSKLRRSEHAPHASDTIDSRAPDHRTCARRRRRLSFGNVEHIPALSDGKIKRFEGRMCMKLNLS